MPTTPHWLRRTFSWWFAPSERHHLGVFRVLLVGFTGWSFLTRLWDRLPRYALRPPEFFEPVSLATWLHVPLPLQADWVNPLRSAMVLLLCLALLGLLTRLSLIALALLNLYLGLAANCWGYTAHATALPTLVLLVLAVAPGSTTFSIDSVLARKSAGYRRLLCRPAPSTTRWRGVASIWPVRTVLVLFCLVYFSAGVSKLRYSGWQWTDGKTLAFYLGGGSKRGGREIMRFVAAPTQPDERFRDGWGLVDHAYVGQPTNMGRWVAARPALVRLLATSSLVWELLFGLALLGGRWQRTLLLVGVAFHAGIELTMRINFLSYVVCYGIFVDWGRWADLAISLGPFRSLIRAREPAGLALSAFDVAASSRGPTRASSLPSRSTRAGRQARGRVTPSGLE